MAKQTFLGISLKGGRWYQLYRVNSKKNEKIEVGVPFQGKDEEYLKLLILSADIPKGRSITAHGKGFYEVQRVPKPGDTKV